jgi:peptidase E
MVMTKYILQGGSTKKFSIKKYLNLRRLFNLIPKKSKVLLVFFARPREKWEALFQETKRSRLIFARWDIEYILASDNTEEFVAQIKNCDVVYFRGGDTPMLQKKLEEISDLKNLLESKIVIGSSAGSLVFAKYYYDQDYDQVFDGLNFLSVKMITHYKSIGEYAAMSGENKLRILEAHKEELPVHAIREDEFIIIDK